MPASHRIALLDASVLASAMKRNMLLSLADAGLFRPQWSERILDETERAIAKIIASRNLIDRYPASEARNARLAIASAFGNASVDGYEHLEATFQNLPDQDDAHVIAAAAITKASIIVTENIRDFPTALLAANGIVAKTADRFLMEIFETDQKRAVTALAAMRARFRRPPIAADDLMLRIEVNGLTQTADALRDHVAQL